MIGRSTRKSLQYIAAVALLVPLAGSIRIARGDEPLKPTATVEGITEYHLTNGLRVLLFPDDSKPTVTVNVTYLVGSRHEGLGEKGMAHLLEHMLFKGTPDHPNVWGLLQDHGAEFNGSTSNDRTNYYETLPASDENLKFALELEADRMVNSKVAAEDLKTEMTVVRNEFEMGENNPRMVLSERLLAAAYLWHNYRDSTIGNKSDIERVPIDKLRAFYHKFYRVDNAVLIVAGKFVPESTLKLIHKYFGSIAKPAEPIPSTYTIEPPQDGERHVTLRRVGDVAAIGAVYHIPAGRHVDVAALDVLAEILSREPTGRLYQALVTPGLAVNVGASVSSWAEPAVIEISAEVRSDQNPETVLKTMLETTEGIADAKITDEEVSRARQTLLKQIDLMLRDSGHVGVVLSEFAAMGDWRLLFVTRDRYQAVTKDDVIRVARTYLVSTNRTSGIFHPTKAPKRSIIPDSPSVESILANYRGKSETATVEAFAATPENIEKRTERSTTSKGIRTALLPKKTRGDSIHAVLRFRFGTEKDLTGHETALETLPDLLMRGTSKHTYQQLNDEFDRLKSKVGLTGGPGLVVASIETDRAHLTAIVKLVAEILKSPAFPEDQFQVLIREQVTDLENKLAEPMGQGVNTLSRAMSPWPKESIHYRPTLTEEIERLKSLKIDELKDMHAKYYGAGNLDVAAVGSFDSSAMKELLDAEFGDWKSTAAYERIPTPYRAVEPIDKTIETPDKSNAMVAIGTVLPIKKSDPQYPALAFANFVFGGSPKSRVMNELRHKGGLSYGAQSALQASVLDPHAAFYGFAICAPQNAAKAKDILIKEFQKWSTEGISADELANFKEGYKQAFKQRLADDATVAAELADGLETGRTFFDHAKVIGAVDTMKVEEIDSFVKKAFQDRGIAKIMAGDFSKKGAEKAK